jgi:hypothetical protein
VAALDQHEAAAAPATAPRVVAPPATVATPANAGAAPMGVAAVLSLQRTAGNQAVCRAIDRGLIQRDTPQVSITQADVTPARFSVPVAAGVSVKAKATPANATGVKWKVGKSTVDPASDTTVDETTGVITVGATQGGGKLKATGTSADGATADVEFQAIEKPTAITSSTGSSSGTYSAEFTHTFKGSSAAASGLEGANVNEKFDAQSVTSPFGPFKLKANAAASHGWDLDSSGAMTGPDNVSVDQSLIDANTFVKSASNPSPANSLPQGFTMTQHLFTKTFPAGTLDSAAFMDTDHIRTLEENGGKLQVTLKAGKGSVSIDYAGAAVYRNAKADKATVQASPPKPKAGDWKRNEVQVSVDTAPSGAAVKYSFTGAALGCEVDGSGVVKIGETAGSITVRAGDGGKHFDEVTIQITAPAPVPAQPPAGAKSESAGGDQAPAGAGADESPAG